MVPTYFVLISQPRRQKVYYTFECSALLAVDEKSANKNACYFYHIRKASIKNVLD